MSEYVLLGEADEAINSKRASWETNKIGGVADWMNENYRASLCLLCKKTQSLVVQIYCPLDNSKFHRTIYVFCCLSKECWISSKGWSIYRMQCQVKHKVSKQKTSPKKQVFNTWGDADDDWGNAEDGFDLWSTSDAMPAPENMRSQDFEATTSKLKELLLHDKTLKDCFGPVIHTFLSYHINVFNESDCKPVTADDDHIQDLINKYEDNDKFESSFCGGFDLSGKEIYEKNNMQDVPFHRFWKKVKAFPSQVIRYSLNGLPALFIENPKQSVSRCEYCGAERRFEFQLMPALIPYLTFNDGGKDDQQVEFGTVLVYSCSKSCWNETIPRVEQVMYFADPDLKYFGSQTVS